MNKSLPAPNPRTQESHHREVFWQITVPVIVGTALTLGFGVFAILTAARGGSVRQASDASLIFLILPTMFVALLGMLILAALAFALVWLNHNLPPYARKLQDAFVRVRDGVRTGADKVVEPTLRVRSFFASLSAVRRK